MHFLFAGILLMLFSSCAPSPKPTPEWIPAKTTHTLAANPYFETLWERPIYTKTDNFGNLCAVIDGSLFVVGSKEAKGYANMIAINGKDGTTQWPKEGDEEFENSSTELFTYGGKTVVSLFPKDGSINWKTFFLEARNVG